MAIEVSLEARAGYMWARVTGKFHLGQAEAATTRILRACAARRLVKVLVDIRRISGPISDTQRFRYSEFVARQVVRLSPRAGGPIRLAYLGHEPVIDPERFGATVAYNRAVLLLATDDLAQALAWLEVEEPDPRP